jgi:hypothetical protein
MFFVQTSRGEAPDTSSTTIEQRYAGEIKPLLSKYCGDCHLDGASKGHVDLEPFKSLASVQADRVTWQKVADNLSVHAMPPAKRKTQPSDEERRLIGAWVKEAIDFCDCSGPRDPGRVTIRRLNRVEYNNTIRDLLGVSDFKPAADFPADDMGYGFDNNGDALTMSPLLIEKYLAAAEQALEKADAGIFGTATEDEEQAATRMLEQFAARAYRRPVSSEEVVRILELFKRARTASADYREAMKLAMSGVLVSPNFLFRAEQERSEDPAVAYAIGDHELATRLSYFLWSSMPDVALRTRAETPGALRDPETTKAEISRMLADEKSSAFVTNFVGQWLLMRNLAHHSVDRFRISGFSEELRRDMTLEVEMFFANLIRENRSILELLDSDYTFVNERLAKIYKLEGVTGEEFRRVSLAGTPRGGVLTMPGVLTVTAMPGRTSPVKRGKFVLEQLLASPPPPPPPNIPSFRDRRDDSAKASLRVRFEAHRSDASCIACHARMDPIGFAMENFDAIGRWREKDGGFVIDASGELPEGQSFNGPAELRKVLMGQKDEFVQALVAKMLTYALGRGMELSDRCTIREISEAVAKDGYRFSSMIDNIVASDAFQKRRAKRPPPDDGKATSAQARGTE